MTDLPAVHLAIIQPEGYVHSLGFLDQARYVRYQLRRFGVPVTLAKNRLREDAVNIVFGAHLGFPVEWKRRHTCVFFNLEQLGRGGARVGKPYLELLRSSAVIDYDPANVPEYCADPEDVPVVPFLHAPYLAQAPLMPLEERPIDLLFVGSLNERRRELIRRVESCGVQVALFDHPVYGEERDLYIRQAKAVLNFSFYETSRFEQARAALCLSLGTPLVSEARCRDAAHHAFQEAVCWIEDSIEQYFSEVFLSPGWHADAARRLAAFTRHDPVDAYADLMAFLTGYRQGDRPRIPRAPWQPRQLNMGAGRDYRPGWLNVDTRADAQPDVVLDLSQPLSLPLELPTQLGGSVRLDAGCLDRMHARKVLVQAADLTTLMTNALALLKVEGELEIEVPCERAQTAWQDPTHVRAMNENSWLYFTEWFWYVGWFEHRFDVVQSVWLDAQRRPCEQEHAAFMRVVLRKRFTTPMERTQARAQRADFGGIPEDVFDPAESCSDGGVQAVQAMPPEAMAEEVADAPPAPPPAKREAGQAPQPARAGRPQALRIIPSYAEAWHHASAEEERALLARLPASLPPARRVLQVGAAPAGWAQLYRSRHPEAVWHVQADPGAEPGAGDDTYDLIVVVPGVDTFDQPADLLRRLASRACRGASLFVHATNGVGLDALRRFLEGDLTVEPAGRYGPRQRHLFSPSSLYKLMMDAGWMPRLADRIADQAPDAPARAAVAALASLWQVPPGTAMRRLGMSQLLVEGQLTFGPPAVVQPASQPCCFDVIVPANRARQARLNVESSPGLQEVGARITLVEGAATPAQAVEAGLAQGEAEWVLLCHQDVYFPAGFGHRLQSLLAGIPPAERHRTLIGFAGMAVNDAADGVMQAGFVIDRLNRFDRPESDKVLSIDELALVISRDSLHRIDPALGWHLWATDLCLTSIRQHGTFARIVRLPVFHNSLGDYVLPEDFHRSASVLAAKHAGFGLIHTLCGTIDAKGSPATTGGR